MSLYKDYAEQYFDLGLKPTCISHLKTKYNISENNPEKSPSHSWRRWQVRNPDKNEILSLQWNAANSIGTVLGYFNRCIDIDNCNDISILHKILNLLRLPVDYEWAVKTPNGFHIHIFSDSLLFASNEQLNDGVLSLLPNIENKNKFSRIELRWANHAVLPPTILNGKNYSFINADFPSDKPKWVNLFFVFRVICELCGNSKNGLNFGNFEINNMIFQISASSDSPSEIIAVKGALSDDSVKKATTDVGYIISDKIDCQLLVGVFDDYSNWNSRIFDLPLFIDIETTGLINNPLDYKNYPHIIQLCHSYGKNGTIKNHYIKPEEFTISKEIESLTGITNSLLINDGVLINDALNFNGKNIYNPIIGHNIEFDLSVIDAEYLRILEKQKLTYNNNLLRDGSQVFCTMKKYNQIFGGKYPKLKEMYENLFQDDIPDGIHNAKIDLEILIDCFYLMYLYGYISYNKEKGFF